MAECLGICDIAPMFEYQKHSRFFAQCGGALEELVAGELKELGAGDCQPGYRGVHFRCKPEALYRIAYSTRLASRIIAPLVTFDCHSDRYLHQTALKIEWEKLFSVDETFLIDANVSDSNIGHSHFAAQRLKDGIVDRFRERGGQRPSVDKLNPDLRLHLRIHRNRATISLDLSGGSLHKRGYRLDAVGAPLQETLAAAILRISGWRGERPLFDPFCGSGTFLAEGLLMVSKIAPSRLRTGERPPLASLPDFDAKLWEGVRREIDSAALSIDARHVGGSDIDQKAVRAARKNLRRLPGEPGPYIKRQDFRDIESLENRCIVTNLPYGHRMGEREGVEMLYKEFGDFLKRRCTGSTAWILCGDTGLVKKLGLRPKQRIPIFNGPLECRLVELDLY